MHMLSRFLVKYPLMITKFWKSNRILRSRFYEQSLFHNFYKNRYKLFFGTFSGILALNLTQSGILVRGRCEEFTLDTKNHRRSFLEIWSFCRRDFLFILFAIFSACVAAIINIKIPLQLGVVVNTLSSLDHQISCSFWESMKRPAFMLLFSYIIQASATTSYISLLSLIGERMAMRMRQKLFERIIIQDTPFFDKKRSGDLINRLTADVQDFKSSFKQCISNGLRSVIQIVGSTIALIYISPHLTGIVIFTIPGMVLIGSIMGTFLRQRSQDAQRQNSKAAEVATEAVSNIGTVKSFAMEDIEITTFSKEIELTGNLNTSLGIGIGIFQGLSNLAINGIVFGVLFSGGYMMSHGSLTPGDLISFLVASQTIQRSLGTLSTLFGQIVKAQASGERIIEFLQLKDPVTSPLLSELRERRLVRITSINDSKKAALVEFRNIVFKYPSRVNHRVLDNFTLTIPKGSVVAICGESGAGKSTIASLLQRFYDVTSGEILIDHVNIKDRKVSNLRLDVVGVVSQQPSLFATSVRENIRYGRINATDDEIEDAARQAQAHDFIVQFSHGYNTLVGERGGEALSGGQRQRIAIARAILKNPSVLILDEATSALDTNSEVLVQNALQTVMKGRTVIVIAHRLSTIKSADAIVVLKHGKIVEVGNHDDLMNKKGHYFELVKKQEDSEESNDDN